MSAARNSSVLFLVGEHQRVANAHAAATRAQLEDFVAVVTFDAVNRQTGKSACLFETDDPLKLDPRAAPRHFRSDRAQFDALALTRTKRRGHAVHRTRCKGRNKSEKNQETALHSVRRFRSFRTVQIALMVQSTLLTLAISPLWRHGELLVGSPEDFPRLL